MNPSPESIRANEQLLEKMLILDTSKPFDPRNAVISGTRHPEPTEHSDLRMRMELRDMARFYTPPAKPITSVRIVISREHKTQEQTEKESKSS